MAYLGENIKKLGFGLMRLPKNEDVIDIEQTKKMVDMFLDAGFTYFDTAWGYQGSEDAIRQALVERYPREKFQLATKAASWVRCENKEDAEKQFYTSLERTGAGYFDFYLLHNLGDNRTEVFEKFDMWNFVAERKKEGLIKHMGFSFHSTPEELDKILTKHPEAEFVQLQINYADWEDSGVQSRACYEMARKHGKSVIIMEPVKGGLLANPPDSVQKLFLDEEPNSSFASWGIRFAADLEGIITVLSGMSNVEQMADNISFMKDFKKLSPKQKEILAKAREEMTKIPLISCTSCDYCAKVCPNEIGISGSFKAMNNFKVYRNMKIAKGKMDWLVKDKGRKFANECVGCGACEEVCPQHLEIRSLLSEITDTFDLK